MAREVHRRWGVVLLVATLLAGACWGRSDGPSGRRPCGGGLAPCSEEARGPLPDDVREVVYAHCVSCHAELPFFGAPMPLTDADDFHAASFSDPLRPVYALVSERIRDHVLPMPPWPYARLDTEATAVLDAWIADGAPAGVGTDASSAEPVPPVVPELAPSDDPACDFVAEFRAHREPTVGDATPFPVDGALDRSHCFVFPVPWKGPAHALRIEPIIDSPAIVHHAALRPVDDPTAYSVPGKVGPCRPDQDPGTYAIAFWLPGAGPIVMPQDVGYLLPDETSLMMLQVHYSSQGGFHEDRSGFRVCGTHTLRPEEAQLHWLGSQWIYVAAGGRAIVTSECAVQGEDPVHVLSVMPHMHVLGRRMTIERVGTDRAVEMLHDQPFDFFEQRIYPTDWVLAPGDALRTTCYYENPTTEPVVFGHRTVDEMCFVFTVAYPSGRLSDMEGGLSHGCIAD